MSKDKKRRLFGKMVEKPIIINQQVPLVADDQHSEFDTKLVKKELFFILIAVLFISASFTIIELTNKNTNWIPTLSNSLLKLLIRNY